MSTHPSAFGTVFGSPVEAIGSALGRVNLLGDHTDYNNGFVLPTLIPRRTTVEIAVASNGIAYDDIYSATLNQRVRASRTSQVSGFGQYVSGCLRVIEKAGFSIPPLYIAISSNVPVGAGLSSSAALEVALLRAVNNRFELGIGPVDLAKYAQIAENKFAGVACGIMDQMVCSVGCENEMLFLDTKTLDMQVLPLPEGAELLVVHSGVPRRLSQSAYNVRRQECAEAARQLGLIDLREVTNIDDIQHLPEPLRMRAAHVITENMRVLSACRADAAAFGSLMNESHWSLSREYEVSHPMVDLLIERLQKHKGVFGARMTGAGFGGSCVALIEQGGGESIVNEVYKMPAAVNGSKPRVIVSSRPQYVARSDS